MQDQKTETSEFERSDEKPWTGLALQYRRDDIRPVLRELAGRLVAQLWPPVNPKAAYVSIVSISQALPGLAGPIFENFESSGVNLWVCFSYYLSINDFPVTGIECILNSISKILDLALQQERFDFVDFILKPPAPAGVAAMLVKAKSELAGANPEEILAQYPRVFAPLSDHVINALPSTAALRVLRSLMRFPAARAFLFENGIVTQLFTLLALMRDIQIQQKHILKVMKSIATDIFVATNEDLWKSFFDEMAFALTRKHEDRAAQTEFFEFLLAVPNPEVKAMFLQSECLVRIMNTIHLPACRQAHRHLITYFTEIVRTSPEFATAILELPTGFHRFVNRIMSAETDNAIPIMRLCVAVCSISDEFLCRVITNDIVSNLNGYMGDGNWETKTGCVMLCFYVIANTDRESVLDLLAPFTPAFFAVMENVLSSDTDDGLILDSLRVIHKSVAMTSRNSRVPIYKDIVDHVLSSTVSSDLAALETSENEAIRKLAADIIECINQY